MPIHNKSETEFSLLAAIVHKGDFEVYSGLYSISRSATYIFRNSDSCVRIRSGILLKDLSRSRNKKRSNISTQV